jgi:hypothetical protein
MHDKPYLVQRYHVVANQLGVDHQGSPHTRPARSRASRMSPQDPRIGTSPGEADSPTKEDL